MTVGELLGRCLAAAGAQRCFGPVALPGASTTGGADGAVALPHVAVRDPQLAALLADADGRIGPGPGVAWLPGGVLRLSSRPDAAAASVTVTDPEALCSLVALWSAGAVHAALELVLDLDLDAHAPPDAEPLVASAPGGPAPVLSAELLAGGVVVVVGPGVARAGRLEDLCATAAALGLGVLNTFGAKGVFRWDDAHHHGTIGLQERDGELAGLLDAALVVTCGVDPDELSAAWLDSALVLDVEPDQLAALALRAPAEAPAPPPRPALYDALAAALGPRYVAAEVPLAPARAAADLAAVLPAGGLVAADPGPAGLWVGRALPTEVPGSVIVPATGGRGIAAALALVAALRGRPAVAVTTGPLDGRTAALAEVAEDLGVALLVAAWGDAAPLPSAAAHRDLLAAAFDGGGVRTLEVPVALEESRLLVEVAGPVVAWDRPTSERP